MNDLLRAVALIAALSGLGCVAYLLAHRLLPLASGSARWTAASSLGVFVLTATFFGLSPLHLFRGWTLALGWPTLAWWLNRRLSNAATARATFRAETEKAWTLLKRPLPLAAVALVAILMLARASRALVAPPLAWDSLTYHLVRAAEWAQQGGYFTHISPDAWEAYGYFPAVGDLVSSFGLLFFPSGLATAPLGCLVGAMILLGVYATARRLGACPDAALLAGAACLSISLVTPNLTSGYVDGLVLALTVCAACFFISALESGDLIEGILGLITLGLLCGAKHTGLVPLVFAIAFLFARIFWLPAEARRRWRWGALISGAGVLMGMISYARAWVQTGSPVYPNCVAGFPFNLEFHELVSGRMQGIPPISTRAVLKHMVWDNVIGPHDGTGLGPQTLLILALAIIGLVVLAGQKRHVIFIAWFLLVTAAASGVQLFSSETAGLRVDHWAVSLARYSVPYIGIGAAFAAVIDRRLVRWLLALAVLIGFQQSFPRWNTQLDSAAYRAVAVPLAVAVVAALLLILVSKRVPHRVLLAIGLTAACITTWLCTIRDRFREPYYQTLVDSDQPPYEIHPLDHWLLSPEPIWAALDQPQGLRLAVSAGFAQPGHNWLLYPLFGRRLQNTLDYLPLTQDGTIFDYRDASKWMARTDRNAWLRRLVDARTDYLVLLPPEPPEGAWARELSDVFIPSVNGRNGGWSYRVDRKALLRRIER